MPLIFSALGVGFLPSAPTVTRAVTDKTRKNEYRVGMICLQEVRPTVRVSVLEASQGRNLRHATTPPTF